MTPSQQPIETPVGGFAQLPDPGSAFALDVVVERLRLLKIWAGARRMSDHGPVNAARTAAECPAVDGALKLTSSDGLGLTRRSASCRLTRGRDDRQPTRACPPAVTPGLGASTRPYDPEPAGAAPTPLLLRPEQRAPIGDGVQGPAAADG
jgi:hypothetical protein